MSYISNEKRIVWPVSIADVQRCLGESSADVMTLCQSSRINIWSRCKPIRYGSRADYMLPGPDGEGTGSGETGTPVEPPASNWGIDFPVLLPRVDGGDIPASYAGYYSHRAPTGENGCYARLADFGGTPDDVLLTPILGDYADYTRYGYKHDAPCPFRAFAVSVDEEGSGTFTVSFTIETSRYGIRPWELDMTVLHNKRLALGVVLYSYYSPDDDAQHLAGNDPAWIYQGTLVGPTLATVKETMGDSSNGKAIFTAEFRLTSAQSRPYVAIPCLRPTEQGGAKAPATSSSLTTERVLPGGDRLIVSDDIAGDPYAYVDDSAKADLGNFWYIPLPLPVASFKASGEVSPSSKWTAHVTTYRPLDLGTQLGSGESILYARVVFTLQLDGGTEGMDWQAVTVTLLDDASGQTIDTITFGSVHSTDTLSGTIEAGAYSAATQYRLRAESTSAEASGFLHETAPFGRGTPIDET